MLLETPILRVLSIHRPPRQKLNTDIPELSQDLKSESHDGWIFEENEYVAITLLNLPYVDGSSLFAPEVSF